MPMHPWESMDVVVSIYAISALEIFAFLNLTIKLLSAGVPPDLVLSSHAFRDKLLWTAA